MSPQKDGLHEHEIKRIYDQTDAGDGKRILVDRLHSEDDEGRAALYLWMKDIAPSPALRVWFGGVEKVR